MIIIKNWHFGPVNIWSAPETSILHGEVYGSQSYEDGTMLSIDINRFVGYDDALDCFISMGGNQYKLDEPNAEYDKQFPGARKRMMENLIKNV